ncbi:NeuD/PglB/VioB family sugar acetyltransferase [Actinophytocola sp.]|uniref:NeuD/PglB/VioB family sugar acetyltransferase n=1 Tax=Actinophytocola sp. TaxID=1872138 RepID=UPI002ED313A1
MKRNSPNPAIVHIVGAGGLGREVLDAFFALGYPAEDLVLVDDHVPTTEVHGVPVCRPYEVTGGAFVVAVADPAVRRTLSKRMIGYGLVPTSVVHPRAVLAHDVRPTDGCLILAGAFVSTGVRLGPYTQVHYNVTVGHDTVLDEYVTLLPGATVSGSVTLRSDVTVGCNASVLQTLTIGARTMVGAGAVVTRNQPADRVVVGVPARARP